MLGLRQNNDSSQLSGTIITRQMAETSLSTRPGRLYRLGAMIFSSSSAVGKKEHYRFPPFPQQECYGLCFRREIDEWRESRCVLPERRRMEKLVMWPGECSKPTIGFSQACVTRLHLKERLRRESTTLHAGFHSLVPHFSLRRSVKSSMLFMHGTTGAAARPVSEQRAVACLCGFVFCKGWTLGNRSPRSRSCSTLNSYLTGQNT